MYVWGQIRGLAMDGVVDELRRTMTVMAMFIVLFFVMLAVCTFYLFETAPGMQ